jgi:hypothetical protein
MRIPGRTVIMSQHQQQMAIIHGTAMSAAMDLTGRLASRVQCATIGGADNVLSIQQNNHGLKIAM